MSYLVCNGSLCQCQFGVAPTPLNIPLSTVHSVNLPVATIMDNVFGMNIIPFGMCNSPTHPGYAAAVAVGALPPCVPAITAPWMPGSSTVMIQNKPALTDSSTLICSNGIQIPTGCIKIAQVAQMTVQVS